MTEHLSATSIDRYRQQLMSPAELLDVDDHLVACETCCRKLRDARRLPDAFASVRQNLKGAVEAKLEHPPYEQFSAYVDGALGGIDSEIVQSHLELCRPCAAEVRDLLTLKASLAKDADETAEESRRAPSSASPTRWQRFIAFWHLPFALTPVRAAGMTAAALLLVGTGVILWLNHERRPASEIAQVSPTPVVIEPTPAPPAAPAPSPASRQANTNGATPGPTPPAPGPAPHPPAQKIQPPAPEIIALDDGRRRVALDNAGNVSGLDALAPGDRLAVRQALMTGRLAASPALSDVGGRNGSLMGQSEPGVSFAILDPVGRVVRTDRPVLRWAALPGASGYTVNVYDSNYRQVATSPRLQETVWATAEPLARGQTYSWQVTAARDGEQVLAPVAPAPEARFKVLGKAEADQLDRAQARDPQAHLTLGVLYARAGLLDDAERELRALAEANPKSSVARRLLQDVRTQRELKR